MNQTIQILVVVLLVGASVFFVGRGFVRTLSGKKSSMGKCCSKGCGSEQKESAKPQAADQRTHFMPVEMLQQRRY